MPVNSSVTLLASAARTADASKIERNQAFRGILLVVDVTAIVDTPALLVQVKVKDQNGDYNEVYWAAAAAITDVTGVGEYSYLIYPGVLGTEFDGNEVASLPLPQEWQLVVSHGDGDSITYSVRGHYLL